jgi:polar amino acid transport system permease protein
MDLDFLLILSKIGPLLNGAVTTIFVGLVSCFLGLAIGTSLLLMRHAKYWIVLKIVQVYSSFIRGTPALVQILVFYYVLPPLVGIDIGPITAGIMAIGFNSGAYVAEILRGGLSRIPEGQWESAKALGLRKFLIWRKIILPQVFFSVLPPLVNEFTMVIKVTPLLSVITVVELTRTSQHLITETYRPVEVLTVTAILYFIICFTVSQCGEYLQRRSAKYRM